MDSYFSFLGIIALLLAATTLYGRVRYAEGKVAGEATGTASGVLLMYCFFREKKLLDEDKAGNIFRVNDDGMRGETIIDVSSSKDKTANTT